MWLLYKGERVGASGHAHAHNPATLSPVEKIKQQPLFIAQHKKRILATMAGNESGDLRRGASSSPAAATS